MKRFLIIRRVVGHSMEPTLRENKIVLASGWLRPRSQDLVIADVEGREVIKRAIFSGKTKLSLFGDKHGHYAIVSLDKISGRVIATL